MIRELPDVTMVAIACNKHAETISALYKSLKQIKPAKTILFTDMAIRASDIEVVNIPKLSWKEYNHFCIKNLWKYVSTSHVLVTQWDGHVLRGDRWDDNFLTYDYIGAKWLGQDSYNVGNGGFSLRSRALQHALATDPMIRITTPEDNAICKVYRDYLEENYGFLFAPDDVADRFSFELNQPSDYTFGFHGHHHEPYKPVVVIKRDFAMGDIIGTEPVLEYFHKKGSMVVLDCDPSVYYLFVQHGFPIHHISNLPASVKRQTIDLNGAYEAKPRQLHLQSYYEACGITDGEIRNPRLRFTITERNKPFANYCVLHIDERDQQYRNIHGIRWDQVVAHLKEAYGMDTILIGNGKHPQVTGAISMKLASANFLLYLIAGADLFIGIDSGPAHIASATDVPSVIFFGSVDPGVIYPDTITGKRIIHRHGSKVCEKPFCWGHTPGSQTGTPCYIDNAQPPCTQYTRQDQLRVMQAVFELLEEQKIQIPVAV